MHKTTIMIHNYIQSNTLQKNPKKFTVVCTGKDSKAEKMKICDDNWITTSSGGQFVFLNVIFDSDFQT